jgi:hypothetical protein
MSPFILDKRDLELIELAWHLAIDLFYFKSLIVVLSFFLIKKREIIDSVFTSSVDRASLKWETSPKTN